MGTGDTENGSLELDNLLLYLGLQLSHVQIINIKGKLTPSDIESLHVSQVQREFTVFYKLAARNKLLNTKHQTPLCVP